MIYAMSDIHGCMDELKSKMACVDLSGDNRLLFLGDYIDYGPASGDVLRYIYDLQQEYGPEKVIVLKGNHEDMLLEWIGTFNKKITPAMIATAYDSWLKTDSEQGYITFKTLVTGEQFEQLLEIERRSSFAEINAAAVRMLLETNKDLVEWIRSMKSFYETKTQIFVHAGVDEEAEDLWKWGTPDEMFLWKYPAVKGHFYKTVIAGHVGTSGLAGDDSFHDIYYDGKSHYYIDGTVYRGGKLLLLAYDEESGEYYQVEDTGE